MQYNYYFDICAMCILATIAITSLSRRWVPAYRQRAYFMLFFAMFLSTFSERWETFLQMNPFETWWYHPLEMLLGSVYFIFHLGSGFYYLMYIHAVLDIYVNFRKRSDYVSLYLGYHIGIFFVLVNLFVPILFYYDENGIYHRGPFIFIYYLLAAYYLIYGISMTFRYKKLMRVRTKVVVLSYVFLVVTGIVIQYFLPTVLIENFLGVISITLVYISLQNPSEMVDETLNILNRKAFLEGLDIKTSRKNHHWTIFVTIDNIRALSDEIGYSQAEKVLKKIAAYLKRVGMSDYRLQTYTYRYAEYVFAVTVHSEDEKMIDALIHAISERLHEPWRFSNMAIRVEGHCFLMKYPDHYRTVAELMGRVELFLENIESERDIIVDVGAKLSSPLHKTLDYDILARNSIDNKSAVIKFQPVLSKIYKINYNADVYCFPIDEYGNEVDMRGHIPDVKVTQALLDSDEFVFRSACRSLAFWNAGDKNGKYRAIVGMSQGEISRNDFIRRIKKILREERAEATWITLKLSETTVTTMNNIAERNIKLWGDMKCSVIVDRFGSGYGDLDKILELPVTQVNLDHDVLVKASQSESMKQVTKGMVGLFHDISIFVGASDISSAAEQKMAEELGCDFLMGDYLGAPVKDSSFAGVIDSYFAEG